MERIALQEYQCELAQTIPAKLRQLQQALELCKQSRAMIECLASAKCGGANVDRDELQKLLELFEKRLQVILRTLTKLCQLAAKKPENDRLAAHYKTLFGATLRRPVSDAGADSAHNVIKEHALHLVNVLQKICDLDKTEG